jgi:Spy/CpxP family protein refolding chaperone
MNKLKLATGIVLIFALGILTGVFGSGMYFKSRIDRFRESGPQMRKEMLMKRLTRRLDLTPQQQEKVTVIFEEMREQLFSLRTKHRPEMERIREQGHARIKAILSPEQQKRFDEMMARLKERRRRKAGPFGKHEPGGGPRPPFP